jgi:carbon-monoxide dehydrogenase large subunit
MSVAGRYVGQRITRVEDPRLLSGRGRFTADAAPANALHAVFVRSPFAHAFVHGVESEQARSRPGVAAVLSAGDLHSVSERLQVGPSPPGHERPVFMALADDRVRHVGDPVAIVLAENRYVAEDAAALVEVDYEPLAPLSNAHQAMDPDRPVLFDDIGTNAIYRASTTYGEIHAAFEAADRIVTVTLHQQRYAHIPLETRGGIAEYDPATARLTYLASTQNPHGLRFALSGALGLPIQQIRVISGDVGGGFGQKMVLYREDVALCAASRLVDRPVSWIEDRAENLVASGQAREDSIALEAAVREDGTILGLRGSVVLDQGAYPALPFPAGAFTAHVRALLPDCYRIEAFEFEERVVATTKASYVPYRGPWCSAPWAREVLIDRIARELGLLPEEVRLRNLMPYDAQPSRMTTGASLEGATPRETLERLLEIVDLSALRREQRSRETDQPRLGMGIATLIEPAPGPPEFGAITGFPFPPERAHARLEPDGRLTLFTAQHPHGQSHETTLAQIAADELGIPLDHVRVVHGDTQDSPFSLLGTSGSRAATRASGAALYAVRDIRRQVLEIGGAQLEISSDDLEIVNGVVQAKGVPSRQVTLADVALAAYLGSPSLPADHPVGTLEAGWTFEDPPGGWSSATHLCVVEVDPETGIVRIVRYVVVHDCGPMINPAIVEGQIRGGVAQGIGGALLEESAYDEDGQFLAGTLMDYLLPTAMDVPRIEIVHLESPAIGEVPFRGVGEGGAIGAPPAVTNAVADAIGAEIDELPLTPTRILQALGTIG